VATNANQTAKAGKYGDLRRRLVFLLLALVVYRIGAHIPVPGIDPDQLKQLFNGQQGGILNLFNMFSGGALSRFTIFALGIMPYISASIVMQLMTYVVPTFEQMKKEGEAGRRKITQYTRFGALGLALFQSFGIAVALEASAGLVINPGMGFRMTAVVSLTAGSMFLMWLGEQSSYRCDEPSDLHVDHCGGGLGHLLCGFCGAWSTQDFGQLRAASGGQQGVWRSIVPLAAQAEHGRSDSSDLRVLDHSVAGNLDWLVQLRNI